MKHFENSRSPNPEQALELKRFDSDVLLGELGRRQREDDHKEWRNTLRKAQSCIGQLLDGTEPEYQLDRDVSRAIRTLASAFFRAEK